MTAPDRYRALWRVTLVVATLQTLYAAWFIYRSSFFVEGQRYFCLFDDAMISMRYAANWAEGHGFVWNAHGPPVEGYTNFGWTFIMGLCHLLPLSPSHTCLLVQLLAIPVLWGCLVGTMCLARVCGLPNAAAGFAVVLVAAQWNLNFFTLVGMETGLLTCLVTFGLVETVVALRRRRGRVCPMIWFAAALLVRPDALILLLICAAVMLMTARRGRGRTVGGLVLVSGIVAAHLLWRHHVYGEWVPNTYYLKATGWPLAERLPVGVRNCAWTIGSLGFPLVLGLLAFARPRRWQVVLLGVFVASFAYQAYVGGDAWPRHYRFVVPTTTGLMVLAGAGIAVLAGLFQGRAPSRGATVVLIVTGIAATNFIFREYALLRLDPLGTVANRTSVRYVLAAEQIAPPEVTAAVTWAGAFPYFSGRRCFDLLGKCDPHVARLPARPEVPIAGHNKFDFAYTLDTYRPDIVVDGLRIGGRVLPRNYYPVRVDVDGVSLVLSVRKTSLYVRGGERISWEAAHQIFRSTPR
jgi:hypothetical protein